VTSEGDIWHEGSVASSRRVNAARRYCLDRGESMHNDGIGHCLAPCAASAPLFAPPPKDESGGGVLARGLVADAERTGRVDGSHRGR
jgi:hypothetical protein